MQSVKPVLFSPRSGVQRWMETGVQRWMETGVQRWMEMDAWSSVWVVQKGQRVDPFCFASADRVVVS